MITTCPKCHQEYDDVYRTTQCPHKSFQMHCSVFVEGKQGCAHTVEELNEAVKSKVVPNPDCSYMLALNNMLEEMEIDSVVERAVDETNAEIVANNGLLPDESCHFGDCE